MDRVAGGGGEGERGQLVSRQTISSWRRESRAVIERAACEGIAMGLEDDALVKHVRAAYPFGERAMWPYKIWLDEVRRSFGLAPPPEPIVVDWFPALKGGES